MNTFTLRIVTPEEEIFNAQVISVSVPGKMGGFGVLTDHATLVSQLRDRFVEIRKTDGQDVVVRVGGGYVKIQNNEMIILATSASIEAEVPHMPG